MSKRQTLLITFILCILATVAFVGLKSGRFGTTSNSSGGASGEIDFPHPQGDSQQHSLTKRERHDESDAKALRELEIEFDKILPAQFPEQFSSLCDATLNPGETLVLGGFKTAGGNYEFTMLEAKPIKADGTPFEPGEMRDTPLQYKVTPRTFVMRPEASSELGLGSLISPAKTRIQKSVVYPPDETPLRPENTLAMMTGASITLRPDTAGSLSLVKEKQARVISLIVNPGDAEGSIRIRTRIESPTGNWPR